MEYRRNETLVDTSESPHALLRPLQLRNIRIKEQGFWFPWQTDRLRTALLHGYGELEKSHTVENIRIAAGASEGKYEGTWFADSDFYKWLEGACYYLSYSSDDGEIASIVRESVELISSAQLPDGYLDTYFQLSEPENKWKNMAAGHELYCAGHLMQAAVAHHRVTGETKLIEVAVRLADHIDSLFGPDKRQEPGGHPEIEMGLIELYRSTGTGRYLDLARFFIGQRGKGYLGGEDHHQDHIPVRDAARVAGHAVRQLYLLSGVTDLYLETGESKLASVLSRLWNDMTSKRMHVTGGVGATAKIRIAGGVDNPYYRGEAFGDDYELPNFNVHNETCAQIASVMWNWRMLLATNEARYADLMEWTLYNGALSGISLSGDKFFYTNALASRGDVERKHWFSVPCCPPNIMRMLASLNNYVATADDSGIQIHLYEKTAISAHLSEDRHISVSVETDYPWDGDVTITVDDAGEKDLTVALRIPGWCRSYTATVNSDPVNRKPEPGSYLRIDRRWEAGDVIKVSLNMEAVFLEAHPFLEAARHAVVLSRGPLVYCIEDVDQKNDVAAYKLEVDIGEKPSSRWNKDLLKGIVVLNAEGRIIDQSGDWKDEIYRRVDSGRVESRKTTLSAVPYFAWANRRKGCMTVWIPRS